MLFPQAPVAGESLIGFVVRSLGENHLGPPVQFLKGLGVDLTIKGDVLGRSRRLCLSCGRPLH